MKTFVRYILIMAAVAVMAATVAQAQPGRRFYVDAGWQFNATPGNSFASSANGWGAYVEGGYYVLPRIAVGVFGSFNTNNDYVPRMTYFGEDGSALTSDMVNSIYQIPFGATLRYRLAFKDSQWGFYVSPEIGFTWHPFHKSNFGFQLAVYYSYATNRSRAFGIDGINNVGFKLGVSF